MVSAPTHTCPILPSLGCPSLSKSLSCLPQVFPPAPVRPAYSFYNRLQELASLLPRPDKPCPAYVEPMTGKRVLGREWGRQQAAESDLSPLLFFSGLSPGGQRAVASGCRSGAAGPSRLPAAPGGGADPGA